jgi:hypothetical protein
VNWLTPSFSKTPTWQAKGEKPMGKENGKEKMCDSQLSIEEAQRIGAAEEYALSEEDVEGCEIESADNYEKW